MNTNTNVSTQQMLQTANQEDSEFLNALLTGSDSVSGSPLWSPTPSDSGISEDSPSDQGDSPQRPESPQGHPQYFAPRPPTKTSPEASFPSESDQQAFRHTDYIGYRSVKKIKAMLVRLETSSGLVLFKLNKSLKSRHEVIPLPKFKKKWLKTSEVQLKGLLRHFYLTAWASVSHVVASLCVQIPGMLPSPQAGWGLRSILLTHTDHSCHPGFRSLSKICCCLARRSL